MRDFIPIRCKHFSFLSDECPACAEEANAQTPITDPAVIEATFAADFEAEGEPGHEEAR